MSDEAKPVDTTPVAAPTAEAAQPADTTSAPVTSEPAATESKPAEETPAKTEESATEGAGAAAAPVEEKKEAPKEVEPIHSGVLSYKGPEKFPKNLLGHQKAFFWFGDEPVPTSRLSNFLQHAKADGHHAAAWSNETGKGLLYFAKHEKDKEHPTGVIPLADVSDVSTVGGNEFVFKVNGQKYDFITVSLRERDGWLKGLKSEIETAVGKKESVTGSDGYKKTMEGFKPAAAGASVAGATAAATTPAKKSDERGTRETNGTSKSQSRSVSRGKRGSIFDRLAGKKDEVKDDATTKKDEIKEAATDKKEDLKESVGAKKDETKTDEPAKVDEPTTTAKTNPEETAAVGAAPVAAAAEEHKTEEPTKTEETKQGGRRGSRFGDFFKKVTEPKSPVVHDKHTTEPATAVTAKDTEEPKAEDKKDEEGATAAVAAAPLPVVAGEEAKKEEKKDTAASPKTEKKNFFDRFKPKEPTAKPTTTAAPKTETPATESSKPADPVPDVAATTAVAPLEPTTEAEPAKDTLPVSGETDTRPSAEHKEKRRSSFFSGDLTGSLKKIGQKADPTKKSSEEAPHTNGDHAKTAEPAKDATPVAAPSPAAPASKKEKEHKENPLEKLGRRLSTALRGGPKESKKETPAPAKSEETPATTEPATTEAPTTTTEDAKPDETKATEGEKPVNSIGDVVPEAVNVGSAPPANTTVSATA